MNKNRISYDNFTSVSHPGESLADTLQRLDREYNSRVQLAKDLRISRRTLYTMLEENKVSEYGRRDFKEQMVVK